MEKYKLILIYRISNKIFSFRFLLCLSISTIIFFLSFPGVNQTVPVPALNQSKMDFSLPDDFKKNFTVITGTFCEFETVGCFKVSPIRETLLIVRSGSATMTRTTCIVTCSNKKAYYAGLINGRTCICSLSTASVIAETLKTSNLCNIKCAGNQLQTCGGKKSIEVFRIKSPCQDVKNLSQDLEETHFVGCFRYIPNIKKMIYQDSLRNCILFCGLENLPLALWNEEKNVCICDRFTQSFNLQQKQSNCDSSTWTVYHTLVENNFCKPLQFLPEHSTFKRFALLSCPGSGNTWTRHLIEQASGIFTGSHFVDIRLDQLGYIGERVDNNRNQTLVIKHHMYKRNHMHMFDCIILLVRNPYRAMLAEFNRRSTPLMHHLDHAERELFFSEKFSSYVEEFRSLQPWFHLFPWLIESKKPFHLLIYEDMVKNPVKEIRKVMDFLKEQTGFEPVGLEQRLLCMSENLKGIAKRKSRDLGRNPFTAEMKKHIDSEIKEAKKILFRFNKDLKLPDYISI